MVVHRKQLPIVFSDRFKPPLAARSSPCRGTCELPLQSRVEPDFPFSAVAFPEPTSLLKLGLPCNAPVFCPSSGTFAAAKGPPIFEAAISTHRSCNTPNDVELEHEIGNEFDAVATKLGAVQSGLQVCSEKKMMMKKLFLPAAAEKLPRVLTQLSLNGHIFSLYKYLLLGDQQSAGRLLFRAGWWSPAVNGTCS